MKHSSMLHRFPKSNKPTCLESCQHIQTKSGQHCGGHADRACGVTPGCSKRALSLEAQINSHFGLGGTDGKKCCSPRGSATLIKM